MPTADQIAKFREAAVAAEFVRHRFKENGVEIPFPQRDVHTKLPAEPVVRAENSGA